MTEESVSPLRQRMIEDMRIRGMGDKAQKSTSGPSKISRPFSGGHPIGRRRRICAPISFT